MTDRPGGDDGPLGHLAEAYVQVALALAHATDSLDGYAASHSERIAALAEAVGRRLGLDEPALHDLRFAALLHDVGKIGIPEEVLRKPGPLSAEEWGLVRIHPVLGDALLQQIAPLRPAARIVRQHQERWDGSGYPDGIAAGRIDLRARIIAAVDTYVAMTGPRPYRAPCSHQEAIEELQRVAGTQLDPDVVAAFAALFQPARPG